MSFAGRIEPATTAAELAEIGALAHVIWREHYPGIISSEQIEYMLGSGYSPEALAAERARGARFVIAREDGRAIGYAGWSPDSDDIGVTWLDRLYVLRQARRAGVAAALLGRAVAAIGGGTLKLRVNRHNDGAIAAYRRLGFTVEREDVKAIGGGFVMDDFIMRRAL